jgi:DNA-binding response OmpR family regulator
MAPRILLVDDNDTVRTTLAQVLELNRFEVVTAASVNEALSQISKGGFDVLLTDLHMPDAGDGMTVVSAMKHSNPLAVTMVFSGYPEMQAAVSAILLQADEVLVKPLDIAALVGMINKKLLSRTAHKRPKLESVASILERDSTAIIRNWLVRVERNTELKGITLSFEERTGHLPRLLNDLVHRLRQPHTLEGEGMPSRAAVAHARLRHQQGYSAAMMVEESRMLQVSIFQTLQNNLNTVDFSLLLADVMTIADEVDWQLAQAMRSYTAAAAVPPRSSACA